MIIAPHIILDDRKLELPISKGNDGFYVQILAKINDQVSAMLSHHCKVMVFRLDLRLYSPSMDNQVMTGFLKRYRKRLQTSLGLMRVGYLWCREQHRANQHHYHLAVLVDGNQYQRPKALINIARQYWDELDIGSIHIPKQCYAVIRRGDDQAYQEQFERLSYLAKVYSKSPSQRSASANDYEGSRIKHKEAA